jgi:hypothetical protein
MVIAVTLLTTLDLSPCCVCVWHRLSLFCLFLRSRSHVHARVRRWWDVLLAASGRLARGGVCGWCVRHLCSLDARVAPWPPRASKMARRHRPHTGTLPSPQLPSINAFTVVVVSRVVSGTRVGARSCSCSSSCTRVRACMRARRAPPRAVVVRPSRPLPCATAAAAHGGSSTRSGTWVSRRSSHARTRRAVTRRGCWTFT